MALLILVARRHYHTFLILILMAGGAILFWPAFPSRSDNFVFYFRDSSRVVPIEMVGSTSYLPLLQVFNLVGQVKGMTAGRNSLKVWLDINQVEFHLNDKTVRVNKAKLRLSDPVRLQNGQWMVPASFLRSVLPLLIHQSVVYRLGTRRAFIGDVKPATFSVRLDPIPNGARLTVQFTDQVNIKTSSRNGDWVLTLGNKPVQPLEQKITFQNAYISNLQFDDQDGIPKLIVTPATDRLNFFSGLDATGKTLQADMVMPSQPLAQLPPAPLPPLPGPPAPGAVVPPSSNVPGAPGAAPPSEGPPLPAIVLDAGHGADDGGARGGSGMLEKDLVAQMVARVRMALLATKKYRVVLTRVGDVNPNLDQRDILANTSRPEVFITFHAGDLGARAPRVVVYTYQPCYLTLPVEAIVLQNGLVPWPKAQLPHLNQSQQLAQAVQAELAKISGAAVDPPGSAPIRVLRSVNAPAVAIEVGSLAPFVDPGALTTPDFQEGIAHAIVAALQTFEGRHS